VKSCNLLAVQAHRQSITTVEGLSDDDGLSTVQRSFWDEFAFQCGYCTPGMLISSTALLENDPDPTEDEIRTHLKGNICRCTGYQDIVRAVQTAARRRREGE
jgi:carbon-monoxide dehydrogenase small subunit